MKKYIIYRIADEDIENYNQHELVGVEYGILTMPWTG